MQIQDTPRKSSRRPIWPIVVGHRESLPFMDHFKPTGHGLFGRLDFQDMFFFDLPYQLASWNSEPSTV